MGRDSEYSVFEYLYRDAGNYKTHACVLLRGRALDEDLATIRLALDDGTFIPARVGLPSLHEQHWRDCGSGFDDDLDHPLHEFDGLRVARPDDIGELVATSTVAQLAERFRALGPQGRGAGESLLLLNDQPVTCPRCGWRTEWEERLDGVQRHTCNNPDCAVEFLACELEQNGSIAAGRAVEQTR